MQLTGGPMKENEMFATLYLTRSIENRSIENQKFTWCLLLHTAKGVSRCDATVETPWEYKTIVPARAAARRWAKRLGIEIVEEQEE